MSVRIRGAGPLVVSLCGLAPATRPYNSEKAGPQTFATTFQVWVRHSWPARANATAGSNGARKISQVWDGWQFQEQTCFWLLKTPKKRYPWNIRGELTGKPAGAYSPSIVPTSQHSPRANEGIAVQVGASAVLSRRAHIQQDDRLSNAGGGSQTPLCFTVLAGETAAPRKGFSGQRRTGRCAAGRNCFALLPLRPGPIRIAQKRLSQICAG